jgi:hypothetical protein
MFVSPDIPRAVMVQIRVRKSRHGGSAEEISDETEYEEEIVEEEPEEPEENNSRGGGLFSKLFGKR